MTDTIGAQYDQPDPRGWLVFHGLPDDLQRAEDATQTHDIVHFGWDSVWNPDTCRREMVRPATDTEKTLLTHLGYSVTDDLTTTVSYESSTLRRREWPALEGGTT
jgi:hypothetical protein